MGSCHRPAPWRIPAGAKASASANPHGCCSVQGRHVRAWGGLLWHTATPLVGSLFAVTETHTDPTPHRCNLPPIKHRVAPEGLNFLCECECWGGGSFSSSLLGRSSITTWPLPEAEMSEVGGGLHTDGLIIAPTVDACVRLLWLQALWVLLGSFCSSDG